MTLILNYIKSLHPKLDFDGFLGGVIWTITIAIVFITIYHWE